jgi:mannosylglycerate hydrolase
MGCRMLMMVPHAGPSLTTSQLAPVHAASGRLVSALARSSITRRQSTGAPSMKPAYRYHVISHAHWDREWYQEFQGFRQRLVFQVDALLDLLRRDRNYRCFHLDGQTAVVQDYLAIRPERRTELQEQLRADRIMIGPWFVMSDEFLVAGESLVRNLLVGARICREFGVEHTPIGYVTDNFGHCSQLPQMLRQIGLNAAILHNGTSGADERTEMVWEGADGSEVLLLKIHPHTSYCDFAFYTYWPPNHEKRPQYILDKKALATTSVLYGMDGSDHAPARADVHDRIRTFARENPDIEFVHSTMRDFLRELWAAMGPNWTRGRIRMRGELRTSTKSGLWNYLHQGTGSSRLPMKQANDLVEWLLYRAAEPLEAWSVQLGEASQGAFLREAWRYLLLTHPHDSIVGCSEDQAHRDMMYRFDQARLLAVNSIRESVQDIGDRVDTARFGPDCQVLTVINCSGHRMGPVCRLELELPSVTYEKLLPGQVMVLVDSGGTKRPTQLLARMPRTRSERFTRKRHEVLTAYTVAHGQSSQPVERLTVVAACTLPPMGYATWKVAFVDAASAPALPAGLAPVRSDARRKSIENEHLRVSARADGRFDILDKRTRRRFAKLHELEDLADRGDGWNFGALKEDRAVISSDARSRRSLKIAVRQDGPLHATIAIRYILRVPAGVEEKTVDEKKILVRSSRLVDLPVHIELSLTAAQPRLEIRTVVNNAARSHRLRAILPTNLACRTWLRDSPFDVVERAVKLPDTTGWREPVQEQHPIRNLVLASDGRHGLAVATKGLNEACVQDRPDRPIALTLFRAFSQTLQMHRTVDSQIQGELVMEYALIPYSTKGAAIPEAVFAQLDDFKAPRPFYVAPAHAGTLPLEASLVTIDGPIELSAVKTAEVGQGVVVRLYNPHPRPVSGMLMPGFPCASATEVDLLERPLGGRIGPDALGRVALSLRSKQILSILLA